MTYQDSLIPLHRDFNLLAVTALSRSGSPDDRGPRPQRRRYRNQRLVCSIVGVE